VKFHGDTKRIERSSTMSSVMETQAGEEAVKGIVGLAGWIGSSGDATGSCVDGGSLTQAAAPYLYTIGSGMLQQESVSNDSLETSVDSSANESATKAPLDAPL